MKDLYLCTDLKKKKMTEMNGGSKFKSIIIKKKQNVSRKQNSCFLNCKYICDLTVGLRRFSTKLVAYQWDAIKSNHIFHTVANSVVLSNIIAS